MQVIQYRCIRTLVEVRGSINIIPVPIITNFLAEWLSADRSQVIVWSTTANNDIVYLKAQLQSPAVFNEISTQPEWGTVYHAMKSVSGKSLTRMFRS